MMIYLCQSPLIYCRFAGIAVQEYRQKVALGKVSVFLCYIAIIKIKLCFGIIYIYFKRLSQVSLSICICHKLIKLALVHIFIFKYRIYQPFPILNQVILIACGHRNKGRIKIKFLIISTYYYGQYSPHWEQLLTYCRQQNEQTHTWQAIRFQVRKYILDLYGDSRVMECRSSSWNFSITVSPPTYVLGFTASFVIDDYQ